MKENTFEIQGREVTLNGKEMMQIYEYYERKTIENKIKYLWVERYSTPPVSESTIINIADTILTRLEDEIDIIQMIEEEIEKYDDKEE